MWALVGEKIALYRWRSLVFGWNLSFASFTIQFFGRYMSLLEIHLQVVRSHLMISTQVAVSKLLCLCSRLCCRDVGPKGPNSKHSLEEHLWHVASTTSTVASLKLARPKTSKTTTAWWLASNLANLPVAMKCRNNNQKSRTSTTQTGSPWENWGILTTSQLHLFYTAWSLLGFCAKVVSLMQLPLL